MGLPNQNREHLADDLMLLHDLQTEMTSIGHFLPQSDAPLANHCSAQAEFSSRVLATSRIAVPYSHIPVTTALVTADPDGALVRGLQRGANVIMPDFSPDPMRALYRIYDDKTHITLEKALDSIEHAGRFMVEGRGDALRFGSGSATVEFRRY